MRVHMTTVITTLLMILLSGPLFADKGKSLYQENCTRCHSTEVFTKADRSVKSLEELKIRVKQCSLASESNWGDEEISIVVDYLNKKFYKF